MCNDLIPLSLTLLAVGLIAAGLSFRAAERGVLTVRYQDRKKEKFLSLMLPALSR